MGGLSKKAYQLEQIEKLHQLPHLILDAGNLLFKQELLSPGLLMQSKITAEGIIDSYNLMGYDAVAVGRNDLAAGLDFLQEKVAVSKFNWLSANLVSKSDGAPMFAPSLVRELGALKVGIIGLTDPSASTRFPGNERVVILPWQTVLPQLVAELTPRCDLIILLSNCDQKQNEAIAAAFADVHIIFQSMPHARNSAPDLKNNTLLAMTGKQGRYLGWMMINWQKSQTWGKTGAARELTLKKQELDGINGRISRMERRNKDNDLAGDAAYQRLTATKERLQSEIIFLENEISGLKESGQTPSTFENHFVALDVGLPDQPEIEKIVKATKEKVNEAGRRHYTEVKKTNESELELDKLIFTGWEACAECHKAQADFWLKTDHASTYQTLVEQNQQFNLDCLPCHVTSEYKDRKVSEADTALLSLPTPLQQVGCEICHGPGKDHAASRRAADISRKPEKTICIRCHTAERDENFNYDNDIEKIACPASTNN